ncbi:MAG: hypothetical protein JXA90_16830 [Planctomycetes bacterium]|nr:hypothetical protein [Planctomycetota bacterium]
MRVHAMRWASAAAGLCLALAASFAFADVGVGVKITDGSRHNFHLAVGAHFGVPEAQVVGVRARNIPDDDLPVVFFLAARARVEPEAIVDLRLGGMSWMQISGRFGIGVDVFHVPVTVDPGPPYGRAIGHFRNRKRSEWHTLQLTDQDVAHLVSVKFMAAHYGCSPDDVLKLHARGEGPLHLHLRLHQAKGGPDHLKIKAGQGAPVKVGPGPVKIQGPDGSPGKGGPAKLKEGGRGGPPGKGGPAKVNEESPAGGGKPRGGGGRGRGRR